MSSQTITSDSIGLGLRVRLRYDVQDLRVAAGVVIESLDITAISATASHRDITIEEHVHAATYGIVLGNDMLADVLNSALSVVR